MSGRKLFRRFGEAGIPPPEIAVVQTVVVTGEEKTLPHSTIAATADAIVEEGIASEGEVSAALAELEAVRRGHHLDLRIAADLPGVDAPSGAAGGEHVALERGLGRQLRALRPGWRTGTATNSRFGSADSIWM